MFDSKKSLLAKKPIVREIGPLFLTKMLRENQGNTEIFLDFSSDEYQLENINGLIFT